MISTSMGRASKVTLVSFEGKFVKNGTLPKFY
jgi:hypothetical protein